MFSFEGRNLIRTFLAGATKDAAIAIHETSKLKRRFK